MNTDEPLNLSGYASEPEDSKSTDSFLSKVNPDVLKALSSDQEQWKKDQPGQPHRGSLVHRSINKSAWFKPDSKESGSQSIANANSALKNSSRTVTVKAK